MTHSFSSVATLLVLTLVLSLTRVLVAPLLSVDKHSDVGVGLPQASGWSSLSPLLGLSSKDASCYSSLEVVFLVSPSLARMGSRPLMVDHNLGFRTGWGRLDGLWVNSCAINGSWNQSQSAPCYFGWC
ncbi:hypothetical protein M0R45_036134 [Rubus argutus]|uniref:Secreted protein n=1 Tax=Rubus argutus TaxID=59490 RepID=A0AAW1W068_RUBAR